MVKIMENPIKHGMFWREKPTIFGNIHILQLVHEANSGFLGLETLTFCQAKPVKDSAARYERVPAERKGNPEFGRVDLGCFDLMRICSSQIL